MGSDRVLAPPALRRRPRGSAVQIYASKESLSEEGWQRKRATDGRTLHGVPEERESGPDLELREVQALPELHDPGQNRLRLARIPEEEVIP